MLITEESFQLAIKECIEHNILKEFLEKYEGEVVKSLLSITQEEYIDIRVEEAREEAKVEALKEAKKETQMEIRREKLESARKMKKAGLSITQIKTFTGLSPHVIKNL